MEPIRTTETDLDSHAVVRGHKFGRLIAADNGLLLASLLLLAVRFVLAATAGLTDDEAYYRLWSLAPALSYLDHPPMVAWLIGAGRAIAGDSELGVRLLAPLILAAGGLALWQTSKHVSDPGTAHYACWFYLAMPLLAVGGVIITPDLPSVLFYGLTVLALLDLDRSQDANRWLAVGLFAGLGLLSKYTNLFAGAAILIWLLAVPENRKWFKSWQLWAGGAIAGLHFLPVLAWNAGHGWASFAKQFGRVGRDSEFGFAFLAELAGGYIALASPVIAIVSAIGLIHVSRRAIAERQSGDVLIVAFVLPPLAYFVLHALHGRVQANWLAPIYPLLALCAAIGLKAIVPVQRRAPIAKCATGIGLVMIGAIYVHALDPLLPLRKDPTTQMRGWPAFAALIEDLRTANAAEWIATSSYATTAQLSFAGAGRVPVLQLNEVVRYENLPPVPTLILERPALYVELERRENTRLLEDCFSRVDRLMSASRDDTSMNRATYSVYRVSGLKADCRDAKNVWRAEQAMR